MKRYVVAAKAEQDIEDIYEFVFTRNRGAARRLIIEFVHFFDLLADQPKIGRDCSDIKKGWRCFPFKTYTVFYRTTSSGVKIMRVLHGARDIAAILE